MLKGGLKMLLKTHHPSRYLSYLLEVDQRIFFKKRDYLALSHYRKGLEGEEKFLHLISDIENIIILWDIRIEMPGEIQYDFIVITEDTVFHFDVKNFSGRYDYEDGIFTSENGYVEKDLVSSLMKGHKKLKQIVKENGFHFNVISKIIFINETLDLRNFPGSKDINFHFDVHKIVNHLKRYQHINSEMQRFANILVEQHKNDSEHEEINYYDFERMKVGIKCSKCGKLGMSHKFKKQYFICSCGHKENNKEVMIRTFDAIAAIKKGRAKTTEIAKWTGLNERTIRYFLSKHYQKVGEARSTCYIEYDF